MSDATSHDTRSRDTVPHVGFVLEQTLGHVTHGQNLQHLVPRQRGIRASFLPIPFEPGERAARLPGWGNWSVRAGIRARRAMRAVGKHDPFDALFIHTQVSAVLSRWTLRSVPRVVSVDATPIQYDELGAHYAHDTGSPRVERLKWRLNRDCFRDARHIVTWSEWAKRGLVDRYEVPPEKVTVIPPGVDCDRWTPPPSPPRDGPVRFLFVGGDLGRKGGHDLVEAFRVVRSRGVDAELHLVTPADVPVEPAVVVHRGLGPNDQALIDLYHRSDVFCLPTLGDCLPMVLSEAGASGLPLVSTDVGAIPEIVRDGVTGLIVPTSSPGDLAEAMLQLADAPDLRQRMGRSAQEHVRAQFDAERNAARLVELLRHVVDEVAGRR